MPNPNPPDSSEDVKRKARDWNKWIFNVLPKLISLLLSPSGGFMNRWVATTELFTAETLPQGVSTSAFARAFWKNNGLTLGNGTILHKIEQGRGRAVLLRHKFGCQWFIKALKGGSSTRKEPDYLALSNMAVAMSPFKLPKPSQEVIIAARRKMKRMLQNDDPPSPRVMYNIVTPLSGNGARTTRTTVAISNLCESNTSFQDLNNMHPNQKRAVFRQLLEFYENGKKQEDSNTEKTALQLISFLHVEGKPYSAQSTVNKLMATSQSKPTSTHLFPTSVGLNALGRSNTAFLMSLMVDMTKRMAEILLSEDDAPLLLTKMIQTPRFIRHIMPAANLKKDGFEEFVRNEVVIKMKEAVEKGNQDTKEQLISLLVEAYPQAWIHKFFGVGRTTLARAKERAIAHVAGAPLPEFARRTITRPGRRAGFKETFLMGWIRRKENTESSPCIRRNHKNGMLIKKTTNTRVRNRSRGYEKYVKDAKEEGEPFYSRPHFYERNDELQLTDTKADGGLCPNCNRYGMETWIMLRNATKVTYPVSDVRHQSSLLQIDEFEIYFKRGGDFYHSLDQTSECIDWCLRFQLSDPFDEFLLCTCSTEDPNDDHRHEHTNRDLMVVKRNEFFEVLILDAYKKLSSMTIVGHCIQKDGSVVKGEVIHIRNDVATIIAEDGVVMTTPWDKVNITPENIDNLLLVDFLYKCQERHTRYIRHLYLDRNQTWGELDIGRTSTWSIYMDYMMKLRAKIWQTNSSNFHVLMNKGCSVHVFCMKEKLTDENMAKSVGLEVGDNRIAWIDSFGSNTAQGGYETLCVIEASVKKGKELNPFLNDLYFMSDAVSGYKTGQSIAGVRNLREIAGVNVRH